MKEKGRNIKIYLLGMLITGTAIGVSSVVADTIINSTNVSYKTTTVKAALDDLYGLTADDIWQKIYPIGSIYISAVSTSPATLFGGTWTEFGKGRTLVGVDTTDDAFKTVEKTDGSKTHTIAVENLPVHNHSIPQLSGTAAANGSAHAHSIPVLYLYRLNTNGSGMDYTNYGAGGSLGGYAVKHETNNVGAGRLGIPAHNTDTNGSHSHSVTTEVSATNECINCSGTALNTQDPYITVYMWKRTA